MSPLDRADWLCQVASAGAPLVAMVVATEVMRRDGGDGAFGMPGEALGLSASGARKGRSWLVDRGFLRRSQWAWHVTSPATPVAETATPVAGKIATPVAAPATPVAAPATLVAETALGVAHKGEDFQKDYQRGGEATTTSDESQSESPEDKTDQSEIPAEGIFDEPTSQPASQPKAKPVPRVNAMDLLTLHGRHLDYFRGNEAGRQEALDAIAGALDLYDAPAVVAAILGEFKATRAKVHIRDLLSLLARRCLAEQAQAVAVVETGLSMDPKCVAKRAEIRALVLARQQAAVVA